MRQLLLLLVIGLLCMPLALAKGETVCTDRDGDLFKVEGGTCGLVDCNDNNIFINQCSESGQYVLKRFENCEICIFSDVKVMNECYLNLILDSSFIDGFSTIPTEQNYDKLPKEKVSLDRKSPEEILIKSPQSRYLLVKEEYFPNWHAYQSGSEVPITKSDIGLMVVENKTGSDILLKYELPIWEKVLFLTGIGGMLFLIYSPKHD